MNNKEKKNYLSGRFNKAVSNSSVNQKLHFHSLRHGFASNLVMRSVPLYIVGKLLGHESIQITQIYVHLNIDELIEAINKL